VPAFLLPDLGEGLSEAEIVTWRVGVGDTVAVDQAVVEVETAKAVVEVPVPFAGRVTVLHGQPGDVLTVGEPLLTVAGDDTESGTSPGPGDDGESGNVLIGYGTSTATARRRRRAHGSAGATRSPAAEAANGRVAVVSPLVRRLARTAGVDITAIRGSGRDGLITRRDVDAAIAAHGTEADLSPKIAPTPRPAAGSAAPATRGAEVTAGSADVVRIPIQGSRKAAADKLSRSRREIPEATVWVDVDATELVSLRTTLNADDSAPKISLLALISRYTLLGLRRFPELNARIEGEEIVMGPAVHLGFAAQTDRGLLVPVVHDAQAHTLEQLSTALAEGTRRAREGKLGLADLTGGTFTINNYGVFGVDGSAAIINHPEVAILGIGRIIERPWVVDSQVVPRRMTQLSLAFDHRVCDGGTAGGFLRFVADCVESPARALRDL
jgi:pyruvate dehydrogenase E2 component (dihydrolipoamide acetyltransferase)